MHPRPSRRQFFAALAAGIAVGAGGLSRPAAAAPHRGLFGAIEIMRNNPSRFPKWEGALARYFAEVPLMKRPCTRSARFDHCQLQEWQAFLDSLADAPPKQQIDAVQTEMNKRRYVLDPINWNLPDYWESPGQFLTRNGDCEDYGIVKFMSLRALGFPQDDMRVVVVHDMNLNVAHAVMSLAYGGRTLILDNQVSRVVPDTAIHHYRPIYAVNETHWWLFRV